MVAIKIFVVLMVVSGDLMASLVPQAILQLVQSNYGERPVLIEVFYTSKKVKIFDETLKLLSSVKQLKVTPINITEVILMGRPKIERCFHDYQNICPQNYSNDAIFLFDTLGTYEVWKERILFYQSIMGRFNLNHLVYCEGASPKNIKSIITRDTYESFLLAQNGQVSLHAMTMFTEKQCRPEQLVKINQFSSLESKWKTQKFFKPRVENFHGCTLWIYFLGQGSEMPFLRYSRTTENKTLAEGATIDLIDSLSTHLNFTYLYGQAAKEDAEKSGLPEWVVKEDYYLLIGPSMLESFSKKSSYPIYPTLDVAVVPPGELFTSWEKLLMPFDRPTWMMNGIVFAVAFVSILFVKLSKSTSVHEFIIGSNVTTPSLNVIAIFMGIGQILLPKRNVSRFFFMVFILFSLIIRTAYQGKYFEFLTSDMRKKPIQTIEELKDKNLSATVHGYHCLHFLCETDLLEG